MPKKSPTIKPSTWIGKNAQSGTKLFGDDRGDDDGVPRPKFKEREIQFAALEKPVPALDPFTPNSNPPRSFQVDAKIKGPHSAEAGDEQQTDQVWFQYLEPLLPKRVYLEVRDLSGSLLWGKAKKISK